VLNQVGADGFDWQVPGLREDLVTALIRSLPKAIRRSFVPAPNYAKAALERISPADGPLLTALGRELHRMGGAALSPEDWQLDRVPDHLKITFRVVDGKNRPLAEGKDLAALKRELAPTMAATVSAAASGIERDGLRDWGDLGTLPKVVEHWRDGHPVKAFPALVDQADSVAVRVLPTEAEQQAAMGAGTRRLVLLTVPPPLRHIHTGLSNASKLTLSHHPHTGVADLIDDCVRCAADKLIADAGGPAWDPDAFAHLRDAVRADLADVALDVVRKVERILATAHSVTTRLAAITGRDPCAGRPPSASEPGQPSPATPAGGGPPALSPSLADIRIQLSELVYRGFVTDTGFDRLDDVARYLAAVERRLDKLPRDPARDRLLTAKVDGVRRAYQELLAGPGASTPPVDDLRLRGLRWMIEELRVSLFAQTLRTPYPVSAERIYRAIDSVAAVHQARR
jgi:ATP-dependent helicase HrpA